MGRGVIKYVVLAALAVTLFLLNLIPNQSDFSLILCYFGFAFLLYAIRLNLDVAFSYREWLFILVGLPMPLIFVFPNLSDDIYRFVWDGYCSISGISPYTYRPSELVGMELNGLTQSLFEKLNSPDYYSIYPTIGQLFFAIASLVSDDLMVQSIILKCIYFILHVLGGVAIYRVFVFNNWSTKSLLVYYANPLVLIEGIGNLHAEINMVSLLFIAFYFWKMKKDATTALFYSFAIMVKLIPIFLLGYFLFRIKEKRCFRFLRNVSLFTLLLSIPIIYGFLAGGFLSSIDLYFRKFEFNASIYYLLRALGYQISGYNLIQYIGPGLFLIFVGFNFRNWIKNQASCSELDFFKSSQLTIFSYLLCSTIVHPWYVITLIAFSIFTHSKYILLWSLLIVLTYINYSYHPYHENLWIVALEYMLLFVAYFVEKHRSGLYKKDTANG